MGLRWPRLQFSRALKWWRGAGGGAAPLPALFNHFFQAVILKCDSKLKPSWRTRDDIAA